MALRLLLMPLLLLVALSIAPASAQQRDLQSEITATTEALKQLREVIEDAEPDDAPALADELRRLRDASRSRLDPIARELARYEADRAGLGPAPGEGDPPEPDLLAERRAHLNARVAELRSLEVHVNANISEATELLTEISTRRVRTLYTDAIRRGAPLVSPALWRDGFVGAGEAWGRIGGYFAQWSEQRGEGGVLAPLLVIFAALAASLLMFGPAHRWIAARFTARLEKFKPTPDRRVVAAGLMMLARAAPGIIGGLIVFEALRAFGLFGEEGEAIAQSAWFALVAALLVSGFARGLLASSNPKWRVAPVRQEQGRRAGFYVTAIVIVFGLKTVLAEIAVATGAGDAVLRLLDGVSAVIVGALLYLLSRRRLWRPDASQEPRAEAADGQGASASDAAQAPSGDRWRFVRRSSRAVALVTVVAPFFGYVDLANFVASRFYALAVILALAWFLRAVMRELAGWAERRIRASGRGDDEGGPVDRFWIHAGIDLVFLIVLIPAILVLIGFRWNAVVDLFMQAFFGFRIGGVEVPSLAKILAAIVAFFVVLGLTRVAQRGLAKGPFAHSRLDIGVQNSLTTLVGYVGLVLALLIGVSALGVNLANLAIIAGALSLGIGFGLQSIVNNFVSGLILLFERPIKVGDWVVTSSGEGTVRKISVRSTEIETFDRSTIIVPNSELISHTVTNWTHRDKIGRITVPVGVSYNSDPEKVREILFRCAREHPLVVHFPEPFVVWMDFGASSLDFQVRAFVRDISTGLKVRNDLRFAIFKAFKEEGIEIPYPQRDVYIKSMPEAARKPSAKGAAPRENPAPPPNEPEEPELAEDD